MHTYSTSSKEAADARPFLVSCTLVLVFVPHLPKVCENVNH